MKNRWWVVKRDDEYFGGVKTDAYGICVIWSPNRDSCEIFFDSDHAWNLALDVKTLTGIDARVVKVVKRGR